MLRTTYAALVAAGSVAVAVALTGHLRDSWRGRGAAGERLAHRLSDRVGGSVTTSPPASAAGAASGFELPVVFGCWGLAFVADLLVQAGLAQVGSVGSTGGRALFAAVSATALQYLLERPASGRLDGGRREGSAYAVALALGVLAGAVVARG